MKKDIHFTSRLLTVSGGLMTLSGILMALCGHLAVGGIFWAASSCMFFAAGSFRTAENKKNQGEESEHGKETV